MHFKLLSHLQKRKLHLGDLKLHFPNFYVGNDEEILIPASEMFAIAELSGSI